MERIIIGIHGLGNKPAPGLLHAWWRRSLHEGFRAIGHPRRNLPLATVYWADLLHRAPENPAITDPRDPLFLKEPYRPSSGKPSPHGAPVGRRIIDLFEKPLKRMELDENGTVWKHLNDLVLRNFFQELEAYYANSLEIAPGAAVPYRDIVRRRLSTMLQAHREKEILLIAHSMGSIIAYDVLALCAPEIRIHTLITIGSPLGIPFVMQKIRQEQNLPRGARLAVPENVGCWINLADPADKVAFDCHLGDDFAANSRAVFASDAAVFNDYAIDGERNAHKSYGYLRTPELALTCFEFLTQGQSAGAIRRSDLLNRLRDGALRLLRLG